MQRKLIEVRTFNVTLMCDCGGEMRTNGITLTTNPPMYPHTCTACGRTDTLTGECYPTTETVEVGDAQFISYDP